MKNWRSDFSVLVAEAQALGSLAAIRSLGRAGYRVIAMADSSSAIGLRSRYTSKALVSPKYRDAAFLTWLSETVKAEKICAIVPSEGLLHAVRPMFMKFQSLMPLPADPRLVYASVSKFDVFHKLNLAGKTTNLPQFAFVGDGIEMPSGDELAAMRHPLFAKFDALYGRTGVEDNIVVRLPDGRSSVTRLRAFLEHYRCGLVQGFCPGVGVGAFLLSWEGNELAHFMHRRIHEVPHTGGASSFRTAWIHAEILSDARTRMKTLDWQGVAMFEYRWDPSTDDFWLIEVNARFWGSLHLALFAGVDFPRLLLDAFFGQPERCCSYRTNVASRWTFPREVEYVLSCVKDRTIPAWRRLWPIAEFLLLGLDPRIRSDLSYPGDRYLYLEMLRRSVTRFLS